MLNKMLSTTALLNAYQLNKVVAVLTLPSLKHVPLHLDCPQEIKPSSPCLKPPSLQPLPEDNPPSEPACKESLEEHTVQPKEVLRLGVTLPKELPRDRDLCLQPTPSALPDKPTLP